MNRAACRPRPSRLNRGGPMHLRTLLAECAKKLNEYGPDSSEVAEFIQKNSRNEEFVQLAELARTLKREVLARTVQREAWRSSHAQTMAVPAKEHSQKSCPPDAASGSPTK